MSLDTFSCSFDFNFAKLLAGEEREKSLQKNLWINDEEKALTTGKSLPSMRAKSAMYGFAVSCRQKNSPGSPGEFENTVKQ